MNGVFHVSPQLSQKNSNWKPAPTSPAGGLMSRPLVYTALTRARLHLSVVHASGPALARAVAQVGEQPRRTQLRFLLAQ